MALKRPEGLSPCYLSMVSPDIPDSMDFSWTFRGASSGDYQTKFTITIYDASQNVVKTYTSSTRSMYCSFSDVGYSFQLGSTYYWSVVVYNKDGVASDPSVRAKFYYDSCPASSSVLWTYIPKQGEVIVRDTYFAEFKSNLLKILADYDGVPSSLTTQVNGLFTGEVVPNKKDFAAFQNVIDYLTSTLESANTSINIYSLISDSLGISDLEKIRKYIDSILTVKPKPVGSIDINTSVPAMYSMISASASSDGKEDTTINVSWDASTVSDQSGNFVFKQVSTSKDVRYYLVTFEYGPGGVYGCELYFNATELTNGDTRSFDMNWDGLYDASNLSDAKFILRAKAVDHRGNESSTTTKVTTFDSNLKVPMGIDHYEVQYYKGNLTDDSYNANGTWLAVGNTTGKSTVHTVSGASGKFWYRIRAIDKTGLATDWRYTGGVTFDPLTAPDAPGNFHAANVGPTQVGLYWNPSARAEYYEVVKWLTPPSAVYTGTNSTGGCWATGLAPNYSYNFYVRAWNRVGCSDWVGLTVKTDKQTYTKYYSSVHAHTWADKGVGWYSNQGVNHTYVYQGSWDGGGNTRGSWYYSYETMREDLKGAEILEFQVKITRVRGGYSDTPYYPRFYLHDRTTDDWSKNHSGTPPVLGPWTAGWPSNVTFVNGETKWVTLPKEMMEWIRDGKATGLMLHEPDGKPYMKFDDGSEIWVKYKK